jgi:hypothetical protein
VCGLLISHDTDEVWGSPDTAILQLFHDTVSVQPLPDIGEDSLHLTLTVFSLLKALMVCGVLLPLLVCRVYTLPLLVCGVASVQLSPDTAAVRCCWCAAFS